MNRNHGLESLKYILWDIDGTLLNFELAEEAAMKRLFDKYGFGELKPEVLDDYKKINKKYWEALERGEITKPEVLVGRFKEFFEKYGFDVEKASSFNEDYQESLGANPVFNEFARELVENSRETYKQYAVTNGTLKAQTGKLTNSGLDKLLDGAFISDVIGVEKPGVEFFEEVFKTVGSDNKEEYLIIGDSLTSDIRGGNNAGIKTCWFNPSRGANTEGVRVDFEVKSMFEIKELLEK